LTPLEERNPQTTLPRSQGSPHGFHQRGHRGYGVHTRTPHTYPRPMHKSKSLTLGCHSCQLHLSGSPYPMPERAHGHTMEEHLYVLSTPAQSRGGTRTPKRRHDESPRIDRDKGPAQPHTLDPEVPTRIMGPHRWLIYHRSPETGCSRSAHLNTQHHIHRRSRERGNSHHHARGASGNSHYPHQIQGPPMDRSLHRIPLQPPLLSTGPHYSPTLPPPHASPPEHLKPPGEPP